ncbi:ubiquitin-like domain-containing CTD phosphatase [Acrasis kona]|uniref:protein-serine/threonine phosphatase n=1 Tax=Acrasis kona TaxID=1008807 RepID=A0AAW2ZG56_9EUKA
MSETEQSIRQTDTIDVKELDLTVKHLGKGEFQIKVPDNFTIKELKDELEKLTSVRSIRQKIIGLEPKSGEIKRIKLSDDCTLRELGVKSNQKFTLVGTPDAYIIKDPHELMGLPDVVNDLTDDFQTTSDEDVLVYAVQDHDRNMRELASRLSKEVHLINEPRKGKKLCVIDIDYTIFDCKQTHNYQVTTELLKRPHVESFLTNVYQNYDICFWSQTSWRWLEAKLTEMNILTSPNYKVSFVLDKETMFEVTSRVRGKLKKHHVKPLQFVWQKFGHLWSAKNTVHIDDLSRNFAMNPNNGIKVSAFKDCANNRDDNELVILSKYLTDVVANSQDVRTLDMRHWKKYCK